MSPEKMVQMANQIAVFFDSQPGGEPAAAVAAHLRDFWEPRMREQLKGYVTTGGADLRASVIAAAGRL